MSDAGGKRYLPAADVLRVFSVGLVAWFHIWQQSWLDPGFFLWGVRFDLQRIVRRGYMAVDLMLLLSGFLLYLPAARAARRGEPAADAGDFYLRRARRILPSYLAAVAIALLFALQEGRGGAVLVKDLLAHLTFTHTFWPETYMWTGLNVVLWTLAVEVQFYLIFPLLSRSFRRAPWLTFSLMAAAGLLSRWVITPRAEVGMLFNQLPCMLDLYALGMLSAHLLAMTEGRRGSVLAALGSLLCLGGILWVLWIQAPADNRDLNQWQMNWRFPLGALGAAFLWCGGHWPARLNAAAGNPLTRFLSGISYNFYIWHQYLAVKLKAWHIPPYVSQMPQMTEGTAWKRAYTAACLAAALGAAVLFTYGVERPAARLGFWRQRGNKNTESAGETAGKEQL